MADVTKNGVFWYLRTNNKTQDTTQDMKCADLFEKTMKICTVDDTAEDFCDDSEEQCAVHTENTVRKGDTASTEFEDKMSDEETLEDQELSSNDGVAKRLTEELAEHEVVTDVAENAELRQDGCVMLTSSRRTRLCNELERHYTEGTKFYKTGAALTRVRQVPVTKMEETGKAHEQASLRKKNKGH